MIRASLSLRKIALFLLLPLLLTTLITLGCAPSVQSYYPGQYFNQDNVYKNNSLGFILPFEGNWNISTDIEQMSKTNRKLAIELHQSGVELLFVGSTVEGLHGTRAIAAHLNQSALDYALSIQEINTDFLDEDYGLEDISAQDREMIRWIYENSGFLFVEYFFTIDTYNLRVSFWSLPEHFEYFLPVYEQIISSVQQF